MHIGVAYFSFDFEPDVSGLYVTVYEGGIHKSVDIN